MILERIREEIERCGKSRNQISLDTGIDNTVLWRIVHGGSCSVQTLEILCDYLGLKLVSRKKARRRK